MAARAFVISKERDMKDFSTTLAAAISVAAIAFVVTSFVIQF